MLRFVARISGWIHRFITSIQALGLSCLKCYLVTSNKNQNKGSHCGDMCEKLAVDERYGLSHASI